MKITYCSIILTKKRFNITLNTHLVMGIRQQNYIIGATISAIAVVLAFASMIPTLQETPTSSTALNALGHATVIMTDAEGNIMLYSQSDNFVVNAALNRIQASVFETGAGVDAKWLSLCGGGAGTTARTADDCDTEMAHARVDGDTGTNASSSLKTGTTAGSTSNTMQVTFTIGSADSGVTFKELGLFTTTDVTGLFAVATLGTPITPALGASVGMTYTVTIGGG